jgi:antitoxin VapB
MTVLIKDEEADRLIRELAGRAGETITEAVKTAVRERLSRLPLRQDEIADRKRRIAELLAEFDSLPIVDRRTPDEIIGYNQHGVFD